MSSRPIADETLVYAELVRVCSVRGGTAELARKAHVSHAMISQIVAGHKRLTPRIARHLGFQLRYVRKAERTPAND